MIRFEEAEQEIRKAEKELAEAEASGASSKRILDLSRRVRRLRREYRQVRYYAEEAKRKKEIAAGERMSFAEMIAEARRMKEKQDGQDQTE